MGFGIVTWSRKGAFLLLAAVVLWTAAPAFACIALMHPAENSRCCHSMGSNCPMPDAGLSSSCCLIHGGDTLAATAPSYSTEQPHQLFISESPAGYVGHAGPNSVIRPAFDAPPPDPSPGGSSILRI